MTSSLRKRTACVWCLAAVAAATLGAGCVVHEHGHFADVDVVDVHGYEHHGFYDDQHNWHGGYYDENHAYHDDPHDWHQ
jgi:hypothetical protein